MFHLYGSVWYLHCFWVVRFCLLVIFLLVFTRTSALAYDLADISVTQSNGIYHINISADIDATAHYVRQVITDYPHAYRINNAIIESEVLDSAIKGNIRVRAKLLLCVPLFCQEAERVDEVTTLASGHIQAVIVPQKSDFRSGKALWKIIPDGQRTRLVYLASIEPDFFIPPLIGPRMVIDNMREQFKSTFQRINQVAAIREEREWDEVYGVAEFARRIKKTPCKPAQKTKLQ